MSFLLVMILLTALLLVLVVWGLWEALHPITEKERPRRIYPTYGPGYSLLQWKEESFHER